MSDKKYDIKKFIQTFLPYLPVLLILLSYYIYFFSNKGELINSSYATHYQAPSSFKFILQHIFAFVLRSVEHGRFIIWLLAVFLFFQLIIKKKRKLLPKEKFLGIYVIAMIGLYVLFIFITQMPFIPRYFMPHFLALTILTMIGATEYFNYKKMKIILPVILLFTVTGNLWKYPEKIATPWDCTLAHLPYYDLRKQCFDFIDKNNIEYQDLSAGFCLSGDRGYIELANHGKIVNDFEDNTRYFIYSNISNLADEIEDEVKNKQKWKAIKSFSKWPVIMTIYERIDEYEEKGIRERKQ